MAVSGVRVSVAVAASVVAAALALVTPTAAASAATAAYPACQPSSGHSAHLPPSGSFVIGGDRVWEVVGCALVYVPAWTAFGGPKPITPVTDTDFSLAAGNTVADGVFIRTLQDGHVYRTVGGAPTYVSTWAPFGGAQASVAIDVRDLQESGAGFPWTALRSSPSSLTQQFVQTQAGRVYEIADGTPLYVTSWTAFGGPRPTTLIDQAAIDHSGGIGQWRFLHRYLPDGEFLEAVFVPGDVVEIFVIAGGAPIYLPTLANLPAVDIRIRISEATVARAGSGDPYDNLRAQPADGTFLFGIYGTTGGPGIPAPLYHTYWTSGGAAVPVVNLAHCPAGGVSIEDQAVLMAGTGGVWAHLAALPAHPPTPPC